MGGFLGENDFGNVNNSAWFIFNPNVNAIGYDGAFGDFLPRLANRVLGSDAANVKDLYALTHPVYDQGGGTPWDFVTIWKGSGSKAPSLRK